MKTERSFNILYKVSADWEEIDNLISHILDADKNKEVECIMISRLSVKDGVLQDNFTPIIICKDFASDELYESVSFRNTIDWLREDMVPESGLVLWERQH